MRKIFFIAALAISASLMAQESINWYSAIESNATTDGTTAVGNNTLGSISAYADGSVVAAGSFASCQLTPAAASFLGKSFTGAPYTVNMQTSNNNIWVSKVNKAGQAQWLLHSTRGNGDAIAIATPNGGALVFATTGHTDENAQADDKTLVLMNGTSELLPITHTFVNKNVKYGALFAVAADGNSVTCTGELLNQGTTHDFTALNWSTDGSYYYLLVVIKKAVKFGETTLTPFTGGSLAVLKFDQSGALLGSVLTDQVAMTSTTSNIACSSDKVYVGTVVAIDGLQSILMKTYSTDLTLLRNDTIMGAKENNKNVVQVKRVYPSADGKALYVAGAVNGGLKMGADTLHNVSGKLIGFVIKYDFESKLMTKAYMYGNGANISTITDMFAYKNELYAYGYDWQKKDGNGICMIQLDANLAAMDTTGLFLTSGSEATWNAVEADGNIVFAANVAKGKELKFAADNTKSVQTSTLSRILASVKLSDPVSTAIETVAPAAVKAQKIIRNGQVLIIRDGKTYNTLGARVE